MANFLSQLQRYDGPEMETIILDMQDELQDEIECRHTLDSETPQRILEAKEFLDKGSKHVDSQLQRLTEIDKQLRELVAENEQLQSADAEYTALITSEPYVNLADKIASLYAISAELTSFLVQKGRRGRPPINY